MTRARVIRTIDKLLGIADAALAMGDPRLAACAIRGAERLARENGIQVLILAELAADYTQHVTEAHPRGRN